LANNGHLLAFDNISSLPSSLSDALCRLASGGSFALSQLYTDADEVLQAARPTMLNGIEDLITRRFGGPGDLSYDGIPSRPATSSGSRALAPVRTASATHLGRIARCGGARPAHARSHSIRSITAHGRFRKMGDRLRNRALVTEYIPEGLRR
jgi:hypothetical protein